MNPRTRRKRRQRRKVSRWHYDNHGVIVSYLREQEQGDPSVEERVWRFAKRLKAGRQPLLWVVVDEDPETMQPLRWVLAPIAEGTPGPIVLYGVRA